MAALAAGCATGVAPPAVPTEQAAEALPTAAATWTPADLDLGADRPVTTRQGTWSPPPTETAAAAAAPVRDEVAPATAGDVVRRWEQRGAAALAMIDHPWEQLGYTIRFLPPRQGIKGMIHPAERRIDIYVRDDDPIEVVASTIAHELGHAIDVEHGSAERRARWLELRGAPAHLPWFACDGCDDLSYGAGDFAEVFALWLVGPVDFRSRVAGPPSERVLRQDLAPLFDPAWQAPPSDADGPDASEEPEPSPSPERSGLIRCYWYRCP